MNGNFNRFGIPDVLRVGKKTLGMHVVMASLCAMTLSAAFAQEIPFGVNDKDRLQAILSESKTHLAAATNDVKWLEAAGIASHQLAAQNVKSASEDAVMYLKKANALMPRNAELMAYLGSAYAMLGRDSGFVVNKVSNVNKGLAMLDKAVKLAPDDPMVRFIRGSVSYGVPVMFSRKDTAEADYLFFVKKAESDASLNPERLAEAYYKLGRLATEKKQHGAAAEYYQKAQRALPQSTWAEQAARART